MARKLSLCPCGGSSVSPTDGHFVVDSDVIVDYGAQGDTAYQT